MCFDDTARPPLPPVRGGAGDSGDLLLRSADGTDFGAFYAHPDGRSDVGVVVLPDVRGLHGFYTELARRFAEAGLHAAAIDYFGRTAGVGPRDSSFSFREHVGTLDFDQVGDDVGAAVDWLRGLAGATVASVFTVGFCLGGALSWRQSAARHGLAGCIGLYGQPERARDTIAGMTAPLLLLAAGQDNTPVADVERFAAEVRKAGVEAELHVYANAPHSFFDRRPEEYGAECDDAWRRMLDFISRHRRA
ncbi:MAG: dienelactone hydrolase family protein [Acidimicrobiales bacterium]